MGKPSPHLNHSTGYDTYHHERRGFYYARSQSERPSQDFRPREGRYDLHWHKGEERSVRSHLWRVWRTCNNERHCAVQGNLERRASSKELSATVRIMIVAGYCQTLFSVADNGSECRI